MNYFIPETPEDIVALKEQPISAELMATAITGIVNLAKSQGQSLDDLTIQMLADDPILDKVQRLWLVDLIKQAWRTIDN